MYKRKYKKCMVMVDNIITIVNGRSSSSTHGRQSRTNTLASRQSFPAKMQAVDKNWIKLVLRLKFIVFFVTTSYNGKKNIQVNAKVVDN